MNSHDLAKLLLTLPDLPIAVSAHGHTYSSVWHKNSHGPLQIGKSDINYGDNELHIVIGDMLRYRINEDIEILYPG